LFNANFSNISAILCHKKKATLELGVNKYKKKVRCKHIICLTSFAMLWPYWEVAEVYGHNFGGLTIQGFFYNLNLIHSVQYMGSEINAEAKLLLFERKL
jgi:hypothetical protein